VSKTTDETYEACPQCYCLVLEQHFHNHLNVWHKITSDPQCTEWIANEQGVKERCVRMAPHPFPCMPNKPPTRCQVKLKVMDVNNHIVRLMCIYPYGHTGNHYTYDDASIASDSYTWGSR
jgi:hypothetical protein